MVGRLSRSKSTLLLHRPKSITNAKRPRSLKPQKARKLIRRYHVLQKQRATLLRKITKAQLESLDLDSTELAKYLKREYPQHAKSYLTHKEIAQKSGNLTTLVNIESSDIHKICTQLGDIDGEIASLGGIEAYQVASTQGQDSLRGGDSSKKLVEWLKANYSPIISGPNTLNALEIGCLSANNAISTSKIFLEVIKIDLNTQNQSKILQQDFMLRPLPRNDSERFNLISCSLVINFVPSPSQRGDMLRRITRFLKPPSNGSMSTVFMVLPLPCVTNSRYFDHLSMDEIMNSLGFTKTCYYEAKKIAYWLYDWNGNVNHDFTFQKKEKHTGPKRNNFCITLDRHTRLQ